MPTEIIRKSLYGGNVAIEFLPNSHTYRINGKRIPSVTSVLGIIAKPALIYWAANMTADYIKERIEAGSVIDLDTVELSRKAHQNIKEEAATSGKLVHQWAENFIKGVKQDLPNDDQAKNGIMAFLDWVEQHKVKFVSSERLVYSRQYNFCGHMDAEALIDGKLCVIDFKTSKGIYPEMLLQTAAYQMAAQEEGSVYDETRYIARFDKETGLFEVKEARNVENDYKAFLAALNLSNHLKTMK